MKFTMQWTMAALCAASLSACGGGGPDATGALPDAAAGARASALQLPPGDRLKPGGTGNQAPYGSISIEPLRKADRYDRLGINGGEVLQLNAKVVDPEGDAIAIRWRATPLDDIGTALRPPVDLGGAAALAWDLASQPLGDFFDPMLCQRVAGQRVRIELLASDAYGHLRKPSTDEREIFVVCVPE